MEAVGSGLYIDYDTIYIAKLEQNESITKEGYLILYNDGDIAGLLDINKDYVWNINKTTLKKKG